MENFTEQMKAKPGMLPELAVQSKRASRARQYRHPWTKASHAIGVKSAAKRKVAKEGTLFAGLRKPTEVIVLVVTLIAYGCPVQAIVHAFGLDVRTVARWRDRARAQCERVHQAVVEQSKLDLGHVQADGIRVKGCGKIVWMGLALLVSTRLFLARVVSPMRDRALAKRLLGQVRACARGVSALLVCTDGWAAYPKSIRHAFRIAYGVLEQAMALLAASRGGLVLNTAIIPRFNGTMRERLATLTRKCRHAAYRLVALHTGLYLLGCKPRHA